MKLKGELFAPPVAVADGVPAALLPDCPKVDPNPCVKGVLCSPAFALEALWKKLLLPDSPDPVAKPCGTSCSWEGTELKAPLLSGAAGAGGASGSGGAWLEVCAPDSPGVPVGKLLGWLGADPGNVNGVRPPFAGLAGLLPAALPWGAAWELKVPKSPLVAVKNGLPAVLLPVCPNLAANPSGKGNSCSPAFLPGELVEDVLLPNGPKPVAKPGGVSCSLGGAELNVLLL